MIDFNKALINPSAVFKSPDDVLHSKELSRQQKIKVLHRWEYDEREIEVAEEENMQSTIKRTDVLDTILRALLTLGDDTTNSTHTTAPNKQRGTEEED